MYRLLHLLLVMAPLGLYAQESEDDLSYFHKNAHHSLVLLDSQINSPYSDIAPHRYASKFYFSSLVEEPSTHKMVQRIFTIADNGVPLPFEIEPIDPSYHMAFSSLNVKGNRLYYCLYKTDSEGDITKSRIYSREKDFNGDWRAPQPLPRFFDLNGYKAIHPATGIFRDTRSEVLFFISDKRGGVGKQDIWFSVLDRKGQFTELQLFPFNTKFDEATPFFDVGSQTLYFSSNGHQSYGGFDVFRSRYKGNGKWALPENLGRPINSYQDDLFFNFNERGFHCYLSSDRPNRTCPSDNPKCRDFDIYKVDLKATLKVFMFDELDGSQLGNCNVELRNIKTGEILSTYLELENNFASLGLSPGEDYELIISKPAYRPIFEQVNTNGMDFFKPSFLQLNLRPFNAKAVTIGQHRQSTVLEIKPPVSLNKEDQTQSLSNTSSATDRGLTEKVEAPLVEPSSDLTGVAIDSPNKPTDDSSDLNMDFAEISSKSTTDDQVTSLYNSKNTEVKEPDIPTKEEQPVEQPSANVLNNELQSAEVSQDDGEMENPEAINTAERPVGTVVKPRSSTKVPPAKIDKQITSTPVVAETEKPLKNELSEAPDEKAIAKKSQRLLLSDIQQAIFGMDSLNFLQMTNMPKVSLLPGEDPVDLLFYHKELQCLVAFDLKEQNFQPDGTQLMHRYLKSVKGLLKEDQEPSIGITCYNGNESQFVVYTFRDPNNKMEEPAYISTFIYPSQYRGVLPDPQQFMDLVK